MSCVSSVTICIKRSVTALADAQLAWSPWVFLILAAALQIAVWMDGTARRKAQQVIELT